MSFCAETARNLVEATSLRAEIARNFADTIYLHIFMNCKEFRMFHLFYLESRQDFGEEEQKLPKNLSEIISFS